MNYIFYFDESFHDRIIKLTKNGEMNTMVPNSLDSYIGVFWGCRENQIENITEKLDSFEKKYIKRFGLSADKELKSQIISKKNYCHGVRSFSKDTYDFYFDLFALVKTTKPILQIEIISKMEFVLRKIFDYSFFYRYNTINETSFMYSLTKFFNVYHTPELVDCLFNIHDQKTIYNFKKTLLTHLKSVISATENIARKKHENNALKQLYRIINKVDIIISTDSGFDFSYHPNFYGLTNLLDELEISVSSVSLVIDNEEKTFRTAKEFMFGAVSQADSRQSVQIRFSDWISGFIGRFIYAIQNDEDMKEDIINSITDLTDVDLVSRRLLGKEWFEIREKEYELYLLMYNSLIVGHEYYWTTMTTSQCDQAILFYALLRYYESYGSYEEYSKISSTDHSEYYNSRVLAELEEYYKRIQFSF